MPLQNVFILNVYQIANPACQLCNLCQKSHPRKLFLCFIPDSFLVDATSQCGLCFTLSLIPSIVLLGIPLSPCGAISKGRSHFSLGTDSDTPSASSCNPHLSNCLAEKSRAQSLSRSNVQDFSFSKTTMLLGLSLFYSYYLSGLYLPFVLRVLFLWLFLCLFAAAVGINNMIKFQL